MKNFMDLYISFTPVLTVWLNWPFMTFLTICLAPVFATASNWSFMHDVMLRYCSVAASEMYPESLKRPSFEVFIPALQCICLCYLCNEMKFWLSKSGDCRASSSDLKGVQIGETGIIWKYDKWVNVIFLTFWNLIYAKIPKCFHIFLQFVKQINMLTSTIFYP